MIEEAYLYKSFKNEGNSMEISKEKSNSSTLNAIGGASNQADLDTNLITIIKEIERKSSNQYSYSESSSNLLLEKNSHRHLKAKQRLEKLGFLYILAFVFLSFLHIFSASNTFIIFYSKDVYNLLTNKTLSLALFCGLGLALNFNWFIANLVAGLGLAKKSPKILIWALGFIFLAFFIFILDLMALIYIMYQIAFDRFGIKELVFLLVEGIFIVCLGFATNYLRIKLEKIKVIKSLEIEQI